MSDFLKKNEASPTIIDVEIQGKTAVDFTIDVHNAGKVQSVWTRNPSVTMTPPNPTTKKHIGDYIRSYFNALMPVPFENMAGNEEGVAPTRQLFDDIVAYYTNENIDEIDLSPKVWENKYAIVVIKVYATA